MSMILRVIVHDSDIRKVIIPEKPADVDALKKVLQENLQLTYTFSVQYEDPDFNHALCNVSDINDLPDRATLKIIPLDTSPSSSQANTVLLSDSDTSEQLSDERKLEWPEDFEIPKFSVNVEYRLRQGNLAFLKDGTTLNVGRDIKHDILEALAGAMYNFKAYPRDEDFAQVAAALIKTHPCLTEQGSKTGSAGWKNSLKFKMANYRSKLRKYGCSDVAVGGKRCATMALNSGIKKPRRFELNFLPNFPNGEDEESQECTRIELVQEMKKSPPNMSLIGKKMDSTFALRRKEIIHSEPPVCEILKKWPALFTESQIFTEFNRISGRNLRSEFYAALDTHSARFFEIFRKKGGNQGRILDEILQQADSKPSDVTLVRTAVLHGLPVLLGDDPEEFFRTCFDVDVDADFSGVDVGLLTVLHEGMPAKRPNALNVDAIRAIILEGTIVVDDVPNLPHAWERLNPIFWWSTSSSSTPEITSTADQNQTTPSESSNKHDIPVTKAAQTLVSDVQEGSGSAQPTVNSHSVHPQIPSQYYPNYLTDPDQTAEVDKINLNVKCGGKIMEVDMFPMESISVLLKEACERAGKKPEKMSLIFEGEPLDVNKRVQEYGLRGGSTVHLIHA